ncbi:MarR family transcriptional regulator [Paenibacillus lutimineralis]|uniref:MarR family transcriptional regulator n=1 Tax=Paenibacillus lutimineralis TaxID=2707005 RepID=A0A3Q9I942_9BACL|nr:MarR family transcriptional regulator [Paenibacillus lutimineralis]AZS15334.1 MarR family transcriptional regulator [Paenibacillus lutimineralis]
MKHMPEGSYPFPMYSGLLEPEHYKNIGSAIWLFLWCISSTTQELREEETVWGIVLGGKPMKLSEIAGYFGVNDKTVSRWLDTLEQHEYIRVTRAARGLILSVRNSKKWTDKNVRSHESEQTKMSDHEVSDKTYMSDQSSSEQTKMSDHEQKLASDRTKMSDLKDIKDLTTTPITVTDWLEEENPDSQANGIFELLNAYCKLHGKFDIHVSPNERIAMGKMVAGGTPNPFTIRTMESLLEAKRLREGARFKLPKSFLYYVDGIEEAWQNHLAALDKPDEMKPTHTPPEQPKRMTKQQRELEDLRRRAEEARKRGQGRGY